ncbi:TPA: hypothetical protein I1462_001891 [Staphylococcus pseudintermedius]|uniref:Uncharacterized protein n=11 Tax=root TaxID=1 RepID=A0A494WIK3_9CAUD|nr:hypothetical protein [Staphylococcus pseudintermedius]YP_010081650.1 hypothetical protein KMD09_gp30 [Staphylococcus phage SN8]YP_010081811.1 hypothetical protein KMD11_gp52 [Staphylococcus phage SP197]YP_010081998.1 hypothetical protein KMD14_gp31 [Staphylococcus phage vB_SpsM_WIS42]APD19763.1 hypothetical protein SpT5_015 [Staphylococcus phage SpT5]APD19898.1 hypothetical protein SpT252_015 [Staphylococcus phage SpT252]ASU01207.1 hypothetical protein [Staphylococcus phage SN13]ASU01276.
MKRNNNWIIWLILISSLFGIANKGVSIVAFIFSIIVLIKYQLIEKEKKSDNLLKEDKSTNSKNLSKQEIKEKEKAQKQFENNQRSIKYFGVPDIDERVTSSTAAKYYPKIKSESEKVIVAVSCYIGKKRHYKRSTNFYVDKDTNARGILILTTENLHFISASNGFVKETYAINKVNGMKKINNYDLEVTYGRSKKYFVLTNFQNPKYFIRKYIDSTM